MASLAEIRAKLKEQESRSSGNSNSGGDNAIYPFWNIKEGESCTFRFLPDGNEDNTFFWAERLMIKLPFAGVKGETDSRPVQVQVPCMEMYGETCDILNEVRGWFKDPSLEDMGRKYWKKRSYIFQGFVTENPLADDKTPENPIRRFIIGPQIFQIIKAALMDQTLVAGLGNIYVLEALWLTKISPLRKANNISKSEVEVLTNSIRRVLTLAIKAGGTSLQDFRQAEGEIGYFQRSLSVYGCLDKQCKNKDCLGIIQRVKQSGRTSYYCNSCQK